MRITVVVQPDQSLPLQHLVPITPSAAGLLRTIQELGVVLEPMYPGETHELLAPYFQINVPDRSIAEEIVARLQACEGIQAAFVKPAAALPIGACLVA